jgi:DNA-binding NtrC family response regulator
VLPPANDPPSKGRIVICDYNALLLSVTGFLRMSGYRVFQAHDGLAARELCHELPNIGLLILNTTGTGVDTPSLVGLVRREHPDLPTLHIGASPLAGMPSNVPTLTESFTPDQLLRIVESLMAEPEIANVHAEYALQHAYSPAQASEE